MVLLCLLYILFASTFIFARQAVLIAPPVFFIALRMMIAGVILLLASKFQKQVFCIKKKELVWFTGIVFFHVYCAYVLEFISLQYLTAAKVSLLYNLTPFITAFFAYIFFKEKLSVRKWIGLIIGFCAFMPVLLTESTQQSSFADTLIAEILLLIAIASSCIGWIFMKKLITTFEHSYFFVNGVGMFFGGLLAGVHAYFFETLPALSCLLHNHTFLFSLFYLIFVGNIICYNLYGNLLKKYSPTTLSFFGITTPLFAALFEWIFFSESVKLSFFITVICAFLGLYIFYKDELKEESYAQE